MLFTENLSLLIQCVNAGRKIHILGFSILCQHALRASDPSWPDSENDLCCLMLLSLQRSRTFGLVVRSALRFGTGTVCEAYFSSLCLVTPASSSSVTISRHLNAALGPLVKMQ